MLGRLLDPQWREDAVVDGVVQEQDLRRFDKNRGQRQQVVFHQHRNPTRQHAGEQFDKGAYEVEGEYCQQHADNAGREIVDQHFKTAFDFAINHTVKTLDHPAAQRTNHHGPHEHGNIGPDNHPHGGHGADDTATLAPHQFTAGIPNQQWQQVGNHRADHLGQCLIGQPAGRNK